MSSRPRNRADYTLTEETPKRRRSRLLWVVAVVVVAAAVELLIVYPNKVTKGQQQADFKSFVVTMRSDVLGCQVALQDGYHALARIHGGDTSQLGVANTILQQDEAYCTLAVNSDLYNLATLSPPNDLNQFNLTPVAHNLYSWAYPGAAGILADAETLLTKPHDQGAIENLRSRVHNMDFLLNSVNQDLAKISAQLNLSPQVVKLNPLTDMPTFVKTQLAS
ncbi:hypothetical protein [Ferrimicrobium acidiphilum]|uniref:DUF4230 domain-containing protein n=1 Tax=Ferrimicrobium acidiphilum TaxID=121039 RepID=A0ABV3XZK6_9ACTN